MKEFPKEFQGIVPREEVRTAYPLGSRVKLKESFIRENCGIFKAKASALARADWEVLDYYYLVGTRKAQYGAMVVGVPYADWKTLAPSLGAPTATFYGTVGVRKDVRLDGERRGFWLVEKSHDHRSFAVMVLTDWQDGGYTEVQQFDPIVDGIAGGFF